jgi:LuxR family transcriptional regulator
MTGATVSSYRAANKLLFPTTRGLGVNNWRKDCLDRLMPASASTTDLLNELRAIVQDLGFEYCSYVLTVPVSLTSPRMVWSSNYPNAWLEHYQEKNYLTVDPIVGMASSDPRPVVWDSQAAKSRHTFWDEAEAFGIRHGWTLMTRGPRMSTGLLSLARSHDAISPNELDDKDMQLVWLSHQIHGLIDPAELRSSLPDSAQHLTEREREVLRWSAEGKTADETGLILGITERTVTYHVTSAMCKLDVTNKTQAVARALLLKLI